MPGARPRGAGKDVEVNGFPVVALVCSAGGLDALGQVLSPLPADLPAAVVVLQHLQPDRISYLAELLQHSTALPVAAAWDGERLEPSRVWICPPGQHTLLTADLSVALIPSGGLPPYRPSADLLLTTLAVAAGDRVIAVVLTGHGNDAATGASAVRRFGGTVIASTVASSTQPAMPQATIDRDKAIDYVVPLDQIADLLIALVTAPMIESDAP
jgi:two-component system chemotaxis response regulator CheB